VPCLALAKLKCQGHSQGQTIAVHLCVLITEEWKVSKQLKFGLQVWNVIHCTISRSHLKVKLIGIHKAQAQNAPENTEDGNKIFKYGRNVIPTKCQVLRTYTHHANISQFSFLSYRASEREDLDLLQNNCNSDKSSAVAEMGDCGHNGHGSKRGGLLCLFRR